MINYTIIAGWSCTPQQELKKNIISGIALILAIGFFAFALNRLSKRSTELSEMNSLLSIIGTLAYLGAAFVVAVIIFFGLVLTLAPWC